LFEQPSLGSQQKADSKHYGVVDDEELQQGMFFENPGDVQTHHHDVKPTLDVLQQAAAEIAMGPGERSFLSSDDEDEDPPEAGGTNRNVHGSEIKETRMYGFGAGDRVNRGLVSDQGKGTSALKKTSEGN
jgi:hypothetical protein